MWSCCCFDRRPGTIMAAAAGRLLLKAPIPILWPAKSDLLWLQAGTAGLGPCTDFVLALGC